MPIGPGKYDEMVTFIRESHLANGVVLIVFGGVKGSSFCIQATPEIQVKIPTLLREMAVNIEKDIERLKNEGKMG